MVVLELVDYLGLFRSVSAALSVPADKCLVCFRQAVTSRQKPDEQPKRRPTGDTPDLSLWTQQGCSLILVDAEQAADQSVQEQSVLLSTQFAAVGYRGSADELSVSVV